MINSSFCISFLFLHPNPNPLHTISSSTSAHLSFSCATHALTLLRFFFIPPLLRCSPPLPSLHLFILILSVLYFQVDAGLSLEIRKTEENYDHMFDLRTAKRVYYLVAFSEEEMNKWVDCICSVCGLKIEATALSPSELSPLLHNSSVSSELSTATTTSTVNTITPSNSNTSNVLTEERYSPQPSVSGGDPMMMMANPTVMAPTPPLQQPPSSSSPSTSSTSSSSQPSTVVHLPPPGPLLQQPNRQPSTQILHQQHLHPSLSSSSNSSNTPPPASSSPSSSSTSSSSSSSVLANAGTKGNSPSLLPINDALLNYIPISECYSGAKPEESSGTSPPPPRPPKPRALQLAGKSQSSLALYPADNVVNNSSSNSPVNGNFTNGQLPPHLQKLATLMLMNGYGTTTGGRMRSPASPLQYSKSMAMTAGGNVLAPPVLVNDQRPAMAAAGGNSFYGLNGGKGSSAGSLSLPPHNHNYEFCNANVVVGPNGTAFVEVPPPVVNRSLKPHRRSASGRTSSMDSTRYFAHKKILLVFEGLMLTFFSIICSPFGSQATRHTLPRPPQFSSYPNRGEDGRKSFNTTHSAHNQQNIGYPNNSHHSNTLSFSHQFGFEKVSFCFCYS